MIKKIVKNISICLMLFLSCISFVNASSKLCNITIYSHINNDNDETIIINDSFNLYQIAKNIDDSYVINDSFKDLNISFDNITSSEVFNLANKLKEYSIKNNIEPDLTATNDNNGYAYFSNLEQGIYLIYQSNKNIEYITNPILINAPYEKDGTLVYDINIDAKYVDKDVIENDDKVDYVTDTSDSTNLDVWLLICGSSLIIFIALSTYYFKNKNN